MVAKILHACQSARLEETPYIKSWVRPRAETFKWSYKYYAGLEHKINASQMSPMESRYVHVYLSYRMDFLYTYTLQVVE